MTAKVVPPAERLLHDLGITKPGEIDVKVIAHAVGAVQSRELIGEEFLPAPPYGYQVVKFRTRFAGKPEPTVETVTLDQEEKDWRIVGITIG